MSVFSKSSDLHTTLVGFWPNLASHLGRSPFHQRFAIMLGSMVQGIPSLVCPFTGEKVHWTFPFVRLTHSYGYASADDRPTCFASLTQDPDRAKGRKPEVILARNPG